MRHGARGEKSHTPEERAEVESLFQRCMLACAAYTLQDDFRDKGKEVNK